MDEKKNDSMHCLECERKLTSDEKAIFMKLVSRDAKEFMCLDCLSRRLGCTVEALEKRIKYYRESGNCVLFR